MIETNTSFQSLINLFIISTSTSEKFDSTLIVRHRRRKIYNFTEKFSESFTNKNWPFSSVCQFRTTSGLKQLTTVVVSSGRWASSSGLLAKMGWAAKVVRQCFLSTWVLLSVVRRVEEALLRHHYCCYTMVRCRRILSSSKKLDGADRCHCSDFFRAYVFRHFTFD